MRDIKLGLTNFGTCAAPLAHVESRSHIRCWFVCACKQKLKVESIQNDVDMMVIREMVLSLLWSFFMLTVNRASKWGIKYELGQQNKLNSRLLCVR